MPAKPVEADADLEMAMASSEDEVVDPNDAPVQELSLEAHFAHLENLGTLDIAHVLQYSTWGRVPVKEAEIEICRFLRSTEIGGGASDGNSQAALAYAKTLGGRGDLLPKMIKTCWAKVDRVRNSVHDDVQCLY
jgi:hypothetical protein